MVDDPNHHHYFPTETLHWEVYACSCMRYVVGLTEGKAKYADLMYKYGHWATSQAIPSFKLWFTSPGSTTSSV